jgi:CxxC-x17-CxxC domain-containing protein
MKDFNRGDGGGRFNGPRSLNNQHSSYPNHRFSRAIHSAICADCGQPCEVPFKPSGDKPVYCYNCFGKKSAFDSGRLAKRNSARPSFQYNEQDRLASFINNQQQQLVILNTKLDNILRLLTAKPASDQSLERAAKDKEEHPVIKEVKKDVKKETTAKKVAAPKKAVKKVVAKNKK